MIKNWLKTNFHSFFSTYSYMYGHPLSCTTLPETPCAPHDRLFVLTGRKRPETKKCESWFRHDAVNHRWRIYKTDYRNLANAIFLPFARTPATPPCISWFQMCVESAEERLLFTRGRWTKIIIITRFIEICRLYKLILAFNKWSIIGRWFVTRFD